MEEYKYKGLKLSTNVIYRGRKYRIIAFDENRYDNIFVGINKEVDGFEIEYSKCATIVEENYQGYVCWVNANKLKILDNNITEDKKECSENEIIYTTEKKKL